MSGPRISEEEWAHSVKLAEVRVQVTRAIYEADLSALDAVIVLAPLVDSYARGARKSASHLPEDR